MHSIPRVYRNFERYFATTAARKTQSGCSGKAVRTTCFLRIPGSTFYLYTRGALRIIAAITQESVITRILRHLQLASVPPPIAPARARQELYAFD